MTKKIFAMFLAVLMVISMLPTSVFAVEKTCPGKGNHTAKNCNNTVLSVTEPTCKVNGFTAYKCNDCGEEFRDNVTRATGEHQWEAAPDVAPTCELPGSIGGFICATCGEKQGETVVPSLSAQANKDYRCEWKVTNTQIDCLTGGEQIWECVNCGAKKTVTIDKKDEHTWSKVELITAATATANGLAKRSCECGKVEEVVVFYAHDCTKSLVDVAGYPKDCAATGLVAHKECRICGTKYGYVKDGKLDPAGTLVALTGTNAGLVAKLVIPASHTFAVEATCADTLLQCTACKQWVNPGVEHDIDWVLTGAETTNPILRKEDATCLKPGYIYDKCANCDKIDLKHLPALGHHLVVVEVPATCGTNAYTMTYCTRPDCTVPAVDATNEGYAIATGDDRYNLKVHSYSFNESAPVVGTGYYMALNQTVTGTVLYFTGNVEGGKLATSNNAAEAVKVYTEKIHLLDTDDFFLYFKNAEGVKTYIEIYKNGSKVEVRLTTSKPASTYNWDSTNKVLTTTLGSGASAKTYFLGAYTDATGNYNAISANLVANAQSTSFYRASLVVTSTTAVPHIISFTMNAEAGVNANNHPGSWTTQVVTPATCTTNGVKISTCTFCGKSYEESIPAAHTWINASDDQVPGKTEKAYQEVGCVDGWQWKICSVDGCGATKKVTTAGSGHVYGEVHEFEPTHVATTGFDTKECVYCPNVVNLTYRVWEFIGAQFDDLTKAQTAHGVSNLENPQILSTGDCTTTGLTRYYCKGCEQYVLVKTEGKHTAPASINGIPVYQAATCNNPGWTLTYECTECHQYIGEAALGEKNEIPALGHDYETPYGHAADHNKCENPDYNENHLVCKRCADTEPGHFVKCFVLNSSVSKAIVNGTELCDKEVVEFYWCEKCQDNHIRSFVEAMGHEYAPSYNDKGEIVFNPGKAPTCTAPGEYTVTCTICGDTDTWFVEPVAHENKDGEKFYNKCNDTVVDRHCVNCCAHKGAGIDHDCVNNKDQNGNPAPCACVIKSEHNYLRVAMPSTCTMPPYYALTCVDCGKHDIELAEKDKDNNAIIFSGHKPAKIDSIPKIGEDGKPIANQYEEVKYPGFIYDEYTYVWYTVNEDGKFVKNSETYMAKFIDRVDATYAADGYDHFYCQICKSEEYNVFEKLSGLGFEMDLNAKQYTYGSLIEVIVSVNGLEELVYGFNFNVDYYNVLPCDCDLTQGSCAGNHSRNSLVFVGYEAMNEDFMFSVTKPESAKKEATHCEITISGTSAKAQNIEINEKTALVKLYFRQNMNEYGAVNFEMSTLVAKKFDAKSAARYIPVPANEDYAVALTRVMGDFNNDGECYYADLYDAMKLLTGELESGMTYDVTIDVDKDGVITVEDILMLYDVLVGSAHEEDLFFLGMSEEEVAQWGVLFPETAKLHCVFCNADITAAQAYCPSCFRMNPHYQLSHPV